MPKIQIYDHIQDYDELDTEPIQEMTRQRTPLPKPQMKHGAHEEIRTSTIMNASRLVTALDRDGIVEITHEAASALGSDASVFSTPRLSLMSSRLACEIYQR